MLLSAHNAYVEHRPGEIRYIFFSVGVIRSRHLIEGKSHDNNYIRFYSMFSQQYLHQTIEFVTIFSAKNYTTCELKFMLPLSRNLYDNLRIGIVFSYWNK